MIDPATGEIKKDGKGKEVGALTTSKLWVTTRRVQDGLAMTIHLKFDIQYATEAGPITRQFSYDHEHENFDMMREGTYSSSNQLNAVRLLGTSFDTRVAAAQAFDNAVAAKLVCTTFHHHCVGYTACYRHLFCPRDS